MYSFDSLTLKYFFQENKDFIQGAIVQKIQQPSRREIILNIRNLEKSQNKKLYINIDPKYPHICFIDDKTQDLRNIEIPSAPPMFCMQLRKYLSGSKIKDFKQIEYDRILEFYFDYMDEIGSLTRICLTAEFMGKYSNIILYNAQNKEIIGCCHNVSSDKSQIRELYGGIKYIYPPLAEKLDILKISYATFCQFKDIKEISDNFYYLHFALLEKIKKDNKLDFQFLQEVVSLHNPQYICEFWGGENINNAIDKYFSNEIFKQILSSKKTKLKKIVSPEIKKCEKIISQQPDDDKAFRYKRKADTIMANLYTKQNIDFELDDNLSLEENAQKLYTLYKKARTAQEYAKKRVQEAKNGLLYYNSILFDIENSSNYTELNEIETELKTENKKASKTPQINKIIYKGYEIYIGKNNKQNDYLISKIAQNEDLWFHGLNYPSAHIILKVPNNKKEPSGEIIEFCAKLTKDNSKARTGGKASIIMTKRKNLKKPPNTYPGYVTYKNETEIII